MTIWVNGHYRQSGDDAIAASDRGFLLGDGLFETLLVHAGQPVFFADHMARLRSSAEVLDMPVPFGDESILKIIRTLAGKQEDLSKDFSVRITLSRGQGPRGIVPPAGNAAKPVMLISLGPAGPARRKPFACIVSSFRRNEGSLTSRIKSLSYLDNILARQEASDIGADEAVMLNNQGQVTSASVGNIFLVMDGERLVTPNTDCGVLPGIVRSKLIAIAREAEIPLEFGFVGEEEYQANPVFITNSLIGLVPAFTFGENEKPMPPLFRALQESYRKLVLSDVKQRSQD